MNRKGAEVAKSLPRKGKSNEPVEEEPLPENGTDTFNLGAAKYEGEWKRFESGIKRHGKGTFTTEEFVYEGDFEEDLFHGEGTLTYQEGTSYIGEFMRGQMTGHGEMTFLDGSRYKGQWRNGRMHGIGTFYTLDGQQWTGAWCHGMSTCPIFPQIPAEPTEEEEEEDVCLPMSD